MNNQRRIGNQDICNNQAKPNADASQNDQRMNDKQANLMNRNAGAQNQLDDGISKGQPTHVKRFGSKNKRDSKPVGLYSTTTSRKTSTGGTKKVWNGV